MSKTPDSTITKPNREHAVKIIDLLSHGLVSGVGRPRPGEMCVEAAVCFALGLPHGDKPPCVGEAVREFKIRLNDCTWSSNQARANGMRKLAVAQLGSDMLDQMEFGKTCYLRGVQQLMPIIFRKAAEEVNSRDKAAFLKIADDCAAVRTFQEAEKAAKAACAYASAYACAYASAYASASASASASAYAYASACASAWFKKSLGDEFLIATAEMGLGVLVEMKSPGCKWLSLCDDIAK